MKSVLDIKLLGGVIGVNVLVKLSDLASREHIVMFGIVQRWGETHEITRTIGAPTAAHSSIIIHVVVEAHWDDMRSGERG